MKFADRPAFVNQYEKEFARQCDIFEPKILAYLDNLPDKRCYLKGIVRHFFIENEQANYDELSQILSYVTMDLQHRGVLEWDGDLKLVLRER